MSLMAIPSFFLKIWGMWPIETFERNSHKQMYTVYRALVFWYYVGFNISQTIECIRLIVRHEPFERVSKCLSVTVTLIAMILKGTIFFKNKVPQRCLQVIDAEIALKARKESEVDLVYQSMLKSNRYMSIWMASSSFCTMVAFVFVSFVDLANAGPAFWKYDNVSFMHELYLPFNKPDHSMFIIFLNVFTALDSVVLNAAIQTTFFGLTAFAILRLKVLTIDLENLHLKSQNVEQALKGVIKEHQSSIRFINGLNDATKYVLLMSFVLNSFEIATVLIQLIAIRDLSTLAFPIFYAFLLVPEVFFFGWMCNEVKEWSLAIADSAYKSLWYNENKNVRVMLGVLMIRAQQPLTMDNGPFGPMTTDTITTTLKAAYSYATLMINQNE